MSYPKNRLIVVDNGNDIDLTTKFGLILLDGYTINPPPLKTYYVDVPGSDGKLDLTEALRGRASYDNRAMEFTFCVINVENVEAKKSELNGFLHGKRYDFKISMDPNYIYHGRFTITEYEYSVYDVGKVLSLKLSIDADPYKKSINDPSKLSL